VRANFQSTGASSKATAANTATRSQASLHFDRRNSNLASQKYHENEDTP